MHPDDSLQVIATTGPWWIKDDNKDTKRGDLILVHVPYISAQPFRLVPTGRTDPTHHDEADFKVEPHDATIPAQRSGLPVAGLPLDEKEIFYAFRAKERPALVLSTCGPPLERQDRTGTAKWRTSPTILVAPCSRAVGWRPELITRIRRCEWPQYLWDFLPHSKDGESVILMGQIQPIGRDFKAYRKTGYCLSDEALALVDDWLGWVFYDTLEEDGDVFIAREHLLSL